MSSNPIPSQQSSLSVRCYRQLMRFYPQKFTAIFGDSVDQAFRDLARDAFRKRGRLGVLLLWFRIIPDFIFSAFELITAKAGDLVKWSFRVRWVCACSVGFAVGLFLSNYLLSFGPNRFHLWIIPLWFVLGLLQSFVITGEYCNRIRWILLSVAGAFIAYTITMAVFPRSDKWLVILPVWVLSLLDFRAVILGAIIGMFQWPAFRKELHRTPSWILACSAGYFACWALMIQTWGPATYIVRHSLDFTGPLSAHFFEISNFVNFLIGGAIFGAITVVPLERILRHQQSQAEPLVQKLTSD